MYVFKSLTINLQNGILLAQYQHPNASAHIDFSHRKQMPVKLCDYHINGRTVFTSFVLVFCYCNVLPRIPCRSSGPDPGSSFVKIIRCWFMVPFCLKFSCLRRPANSDFFHFVTQCVNGNLLPFLQARPKFQAETHPRILGNQDLT